MGSSTISHVSPNIDREIDKLRVLLDKILDVSSTRVFSDNNLIRVRHPDVLGVIFVLGCHDLVSDN